MLRARRGHRALSAVATAGVLFAGACGTDRDGSPNGFETTDSVGIRVVRNGEVGVLPQSVLDSPAVGLRIGAAEGDSTLQFFRLGAIAVADDGVIYAADAGHLEVRVFDREGRFVRRIGRRGSGPGEFEGLGAIYAFGDTVAITDYRLTRLTLFDESGAVLGTEPLRDRNNRGVTVVGRSGGGWLILPPSNPGFDYQHLVERRDTVRVLWSPTIPLALAAAARAPIDSGAARLAPPRDVLVFPGPRRYGNQTPLFLSVVTPLFEPNPTFAVDGRGNIHYTDASSYVIDTFNPTGRHTRRLTRTYSPIPVTDELIGRWTSLMRAHWDTTTLGGELAAGKSNDEARAGLSTVRTLPPIGLLLASRAGSLWVERIDLVPDPLARQGTRVPTPPTPSKWDLFDPEGRFLGTVTLPPRFSPRVAGDRWMLGVLRDDLDVQYVVRYDLDPRG